MKTLRQSLLDYEIPLLEGIAEQRVVSLTTASQKEAVEQLATALLSPVATAITLDDLSEAEREAFEFLLRHGGQIDAPRFLRQFGPIRPMGPGRLERERPWENPANPAEGLWYRGLIFRSFGVTGQGSQEFIYIPTDLQPLLNDYSPASATSSPLQTLTPASQPTFTAGDKGRLRENFFSLLVYLQTHPVRLTAKAELPPKEKQALLDSMLPPPPHLSAPTELELLLHLGKRAGLLTVAHGRLRPERNATREWLQDLPRSQTLLLQNSWRGDPTWNDLWRVPGLVPQPTGWENSPLRARSKILSHLERLTTPAGAWFALDDFVAAIKQLDPDFQRPDGNYESWYIKDADNNFLMGFEHWDEVEGALIRHLLSTTLLLLDVVQVGGSDSSAPPTHFSLTPQGETFLAGPESVDEPPPKPAYLRIDNNFYVRVSPNVSLYDRFQLARIAHLDRREENRVIYQITRPSISRALRNGVTPDQIAAFLTRATNSQIPLKLIETLRTWDARHASARLEQTMLLRLKDEQTAAKLRHHPTLGPLLGQTVGPAAIIIPAQHIAEVRRLLTELGYLD